MLINLFSRRGIKYVTDTNGFSELELTPQEQNALKNNRQGCNKNRKSKNKMKKLSKKRNR